MIHQLIFTNPKPGMSVKEFQNYWIEVHAKQYAGKIKQIKKYKVNKILSVPEWEEPIFHGMAEIWLENEEEQLASLQSTEFIDGARADEPNWAAFWQTVGLDTYSYDKVLCDAEPEYKLLTLMKRKEGIPLDVFRGCLSDRIGKMLEEMQGITQLTVSIVKDSFYSVCESSFDAAIHIWFTDMEAVHKTTKGDAYKAVLSELNKIVNENYLYHFLCQETRII